MRENRRTVMQHFLMLMVLFPLCFWALQIAVSAILSDFTWDDRFAAWLDELLKLEPPGVQTHSPTPVSHRWGIDIITLLPGFWCIRFLTGAVEEIRYTHQINAVYQLEIVSRWIALSAATLLIAPLVGVLFFNAMEFVLWTPLSVLGAVGLSGFLLFWGWQYPNRRVRHVETVYHFEKVKEN